MVYKPPSSELENIPYHAQNELSDLDYHDLRPLINGRKMVFFLFGFYIFLLTTYIFYLLIILLGNPNHLFSYTGIAEVVMCVFLIGFIVALKSSTRSGFYISFIAGLIGLLFFPLGTIFSAIGIRGLIRTRRIYLDPSLSFKKLNMAFEPYR